MIIRFFENKFDFENPYNFTPEQREKFVLGMQDIFGVQNIIREDIIEKSKVFKNPKKRTIMHNYTKEDIVIILNNTSREASKQIGISEFAVKYQQLPLRKKYADWLITNNLNDSEENKIKFAEDYVL